MRKRGAGIVIKDNKIALIKRVKSYDIYYVFPGGGIEDLETPEEATIREVKEELGLEVQVNNLVYHDKKIGHYYFDCNVTGGVIGTGTGDEYKMDNGNRGIYEPLWVSLGAILSIDLRPKKVARLVYSKYRMT